MVELNRHCRETSTSTRPPSRPSRYTLNCEEPDYRAQLVAERTALASRTHAELHGLLPGYQDRVPRLTTPTFITAATDLLGGDTRVRAPLTRRRITSRHHLDLPKRWPAKLTRTVRWAA